MAEREDFSDLMFDSRATVAAQKTAAALLEANQLTRQMLESANADALAAKKSARLANISATIAAITAIISTICAVISVLR